MFNCAINMKKVSVLHVLHSKCKVLCRLWKILGGPVSMWMCVLEALRNRGGIGKSCQNSQGTGIAKLACAAPLMEALL